MGYCILSSILIHLLDAIFRYFNFKYFIHELLLTHDSLLLFSITSIATRSVTLITCKIDFLGDIKEKSESIVIDTLSYAYY